MTFPGDKPFPGDSSGIVCPLNDSRGGYFTRVVLLCLRGSLDFARDDGTLLRVDTRVDINPSRDFRYTLKRSICAIALDMP